MVHCNKKQVHKFQFYCSGYHHKGHRQIKGFYYNVLDFYDTDTKYKLEQLQGYTFC